MSFTTLNKCGVSIEYELNRLPHYVKSIVIYAEELCDNLGRYELGTIMYTQLITIIPKERHTRMTIDECVMYRLVVLHIVIQLLKLDKSCV